MTESLPRLKVTYDLKPHNNNPFNEISPFRKRSFLTSNTIELPDNIFNNNPKPLMDYLPIPIELKIQAKLDSPIQESSPSSSPARRSRSTKPRGGTIDRALIKPRMHRAFRILNTFKKLKNLSQEEEIQIDENSSESNREKSENISVNIEVVDNELVVPQLTTQMSQMTQNTQSNEANEEKKMNMSNSSPTINVRRKNIDNMSDEELRELALMIFQKPVEERSSKELEALVRCLSVVEFFRKYDNKTIKNCLKYMQYRSLSAGEPVFQIGTKGTTFWVILKGKISVWTHEKKVTGHRGEEKVLTKMKVMGAGLSFGELALLERKPRAATIICEEDCHFGVLERAPFRAILKHREAQKLFDEVNFLSSLHMFKKWSYNAVKLMYYSLQLIKCRRGQVIYNEGDQSPSMYIIKSGEFKVLKQIELEDEDEFEFRNLQNGPKKIKPFGRTFDIAILSEKELFGEEEFINNIKRKYKIVCHSQEAEIYQIARNDFENPKLTFKVSEKWLDKNISAKRILYEERILNFQKANKLNSHLLIFKKTESPLRTRSPSPTQATQHSPVFPQINNSVILNDGCERLSFGLAANTSAIDLKELGIKGRLPRHVSQYLEPKTRLDGSIILERDPASYRAGKQIKALESQTARGQIQHSPPTQREHHGGGSPIKHSPSSHANLYSKLMKNNIAELHRRKIQHKVGEAISRDTMRHRKIGSAVGEKSHFFDMPFESFSDMRLLKAPQKNPNNPTAPPDKPEVSNFEKKAVRHVRAASMTMEEKTSELASSEIQSIIIHTPRRQSVVEDIRDDVLVKGLKQKLLEKTSAAGEEWNSIIAEDPSHKTKRMSYTLYNEIIDKASPQQTQIGFKGFFPSTSPRTKAMQAKGQELVRTGSGEKMINAIVEKKNSLVKQITSKLESLNRSSNKDVAGADVSPKAVNEDDGEFEYNFVRAKKRKMLRELLTTNMEVRSIEYTASMHLDKNGPDSLMRE